MKNGYRFVDVDMHVIEPADLFDKYLDPAFKHRVTTPVLGSRPPASRPLGLTPWLIDGTPINLDGLVTQYDRRRRPVITRRARGAIGFALERGYDPESQIMAMEMEGIDIAVLFPSAGLAFLSRDGMEPQLSHAICRAYNDWIHDFCSYNPALLKMAAMLPVHDVNLACQELTRCVERYGAVAAFLRPNYVDGHYWHSNYWTPLYDLLEDFNVPLCFHESTGGYNSTIEPRFGENRVMRHVASHCTEMQLSLIALILGGVFEFHPRLKVCFLEAQSWWVAGLLGRMESDLEDYREADAPFLKLSPFEYWRRNCFATIEGRERDVGPTVELLGGAETLCVSTDYPHFDSDFPHVAENVLTNPGITEKIGGTILAGGARLYGFGDEDFRKADAAMAARKTPIAQNAWAEAREGPVHIPSVQRSAVPTPPPADSVLP
jgi:uncharacterized protein